MGDHRIKPTLGSLIVFALAAVNLAAPTNAVAVGRSPTPCAVVGSIPTNTGEVLEVAAPTARSVRATVSLLRRRGSCFVRTAGPFRAWVGTNGLSAHHLEGDDTTPIGTFGFASLFYGIASNPGVHYRYHRLVCGDWWDEDPASSQYNEFVHVACGTTPPFATGSEALWTEAPAYESFAVVSYNTASRTPGAGSGIFLHQSTGRPTAGCVALSRDDLLVLLRSLVASENPRITISVASGSGN